MENQSDKILATLKQITRALDIQSKNLTRKYGLTGPQLLVLKELYKNSSLSLKQVAENVSLSQATVTSIMDRLEKMQFVMRVRNIHDKRKVNIKLAEKATDILSMNPGLLQEQFSEQFEKLEQWEKNYLLSALQRIALMMNAENIKHVSVMDIEALEAADILDGQG